MTHAACGAGMIAKVNIIPSASQWGCGTAWKSAGNDKGSGGLERWIVGEVHLRKRLFGFVVAAGHKHDGIRMRDREIKDEIREEMVEEKVLRCEYDCPFRKLRRRG